ncbi:MAG: SNF2-related protein [Gammaproteobacteria bacterium]
MEQDLFLYDAERLRSVASDSIVKQGLADFSENRVFFLDVPGERLCAQVEDAENTEPLWLELSHRDGRLEVSCDCHSGDEVCRHAVAALYAYADQTGYAEDTKALGSAVDEAIQARVKKGRNEVRVKLLSGNLGFGTWQASSILSSTHRQQSYQVQIRSLNQRMNYCTCPDLATNRLGTCKHIEAVLHYASNQPDYKRLKEAGCPVSFVYLAWESATRAAIRVHRKSEIEGDLKAILAEFFSPEGVFIGRIPDDYYRLSERVYGRDDFQLGDDVLQYVRQAADDAAQALRGQKIREAILRSNGVLPGIKARLFPYQSEGVAFLASRGRALLADDMGLGKTLQAIAAASWLADNEGVKRVLVICPASLKHQWAREIGKFTAQRVQTIQGGAENRRVQYRSDALFFVINYELVLRDLSVINESLKADLVILDEAQRIKNWRTKLSSTVKLIPSRYVFVLSGTPLENRLEDLYSLLQVVDARVLGPLWRCLLDFHVTDERGKVIGYRNLSELRRRIAPVMLRRNRALVNDQLPDRTEVTLDIPLNAKQQELHDAALMAAGRLAAISKRRPLTPGEQNRMMAALQQARMACDAAGLVDKETKGSPKLDELARLLDELCLQSNRKAVVFSQWALMTEMVESLVRSMGLGCVRLYGGVPSQQRGDLLERFLNDESVQVFISTDAGGTGLNLQSATVLINLDMPWNPAVLDQRIARIHRLGQKHKVQVFILLAEDSYEQRVAGLVKGKRELFDNVISPDASEDVVGVSKEMLKTLIDDLAESALEPGPTEIETPLDESVSEEIPAGREKSAESLADQDRDLGQLIEKIQQRFEFRLERIMASGGGLLVVLDRLEPGDEEAAEELSEADVPVAVIDARALHSLQRLGSASPISAARTVLEQTGAKTPAENPLLKIAEQKLESAEILCERQSTAGVMDLLVSALLLKVAGLNGQSQVPAPESAAVWLYSEIVPAAILSAEQAGIVVRILSLNQAPLVPDDLIEQSLADVRGLFSSLREPFR